MIRSSKTGTRPTIVGGTEELEDRNPLLALGQIAYDEDAGTLRVGVGGEHYNDLPEVGAGGGGSSATGGVLDPITLDPVQWAMLDFYGATDGDALPAATYSNGTEGVGATLTADGNGALSDIKRTLASDRLAGSDSACLSGKLNGAGAAPQVGDRVFYLSMVADAHQGVYTITSLGSAGTPWVLTRATDADDDDDSAKEFIIPLEATDFYALTQRFDDTDSFNGNSAYMGFAFMPTDGFARSYGAMAVGHEGLALGFYTWAGYRARAIGNYCRAMGQGGHAIGYSAQALHEFSVVIGVTDTFGGMDSTGVGSINVGSHDYPATIIGSVTEP